MKYQQRKHCYWSCTGTCKGNNRRPGLWWMVFVVEKETQLHLDLNNEIELKKINSNQPFHRLASQSQLAFMSSPAPLSRRPFGFCRGFCAIWAPVCPELEFFAICSVGRWTQQCFCASWGDLELDFFSLALDLFLPWTGEVSTQMEKNTNTKCFKDQIYAIFLKSRWF